MSSVTASGSRTGVGAGSAIPEAIVKAAAKPARELFSAALERIPAVYESLMKEMARRFLEPELDMEDLWAQHGLNGKNHSKLLSQALGASPWNFNRMRRAQTASFLLTDERIPAAKLYSVAVATGFKSTAALRAAFKAWSGGIKPADYRTRYLAKGQSSALTKALWRPKPVATSREILSSAYRLAMQCTCDEVACDMALDKVREAEALVGEGTSPVLPEDIAAHRGLVRHCRGVDRLLQLDIDGAYEDLIAAFSFYAASPQLPKVIQYARGHLFYSADTRGVLLQELCVPCRAALLVDEGRSVREHLSRALKPVPLDLPWFQACCDPCYRMVWSAFEKARLGLMDNAWKAFWLVAHAEPVEEVPPSLARYIRALHESEILTHREQSPRLELCRLAVETARELGDPLREAYALCFLGNTLRALGRFAEAKSTLHSARECCQGSPWAAAFQALMVGYLATQERETASALAGLQKASTLYRSLDPHFVGLSLIDEGELFFFEGRYEAAVHSFTAAFAALDNRRTPELAKGAVPLNLAASLGALGRAAEAKTALHRCEFDRTAHPGGTATEIFVTGCLALDEDRPEEALCCYQEAAALFESLDRPRGVALANSYSVEAYARLSHRDKAIESAADALRLFQALGCKKDTIEAFAELRQQLEAAVIDAAAVAVSVRSLAHKQGGWLPEPSGAGEPSE